MPSCIALKLAMTTTVLCNNVKFLWLNHTTWSHHLWSTHWSWRVHVCRKYVTWPWPHFYDLLTNYVSFSIAIQSRLAMLDPQIDVSHDLDLILLVYCPSKIDVNFFKLCQLRDRRDISVSTFVFNLSLFKLVTFCMLLPHYPYLILLKNWMLS